MMDFHIGKETKDLVFRYINQSQKYIKIAIFQFHSHDYFDLVCKKLDAGISVEICTLPYDSINPELYEDVVNRFEQIIKKGAKVYFIPWNVGDPARTTTAVGRWYSFHGKFIVTEEVAIALSANLTSEPEIDAVISSDDPQIISEFNNKFNELLRLFVLENDGYSGCIRKMILDVMLDPKKKEQILSVPQVIQNTSHNLTWIRDYPGDLCDSPKQPLRGLYLIPFDGRARVIYQTLISEAGRYVDISAESFTDEDFATFLKEMSFQKNLKIRLLTGSTSQDFSERFRKICLELIACGVELRTTDQALHAKVLITDNAVVVGSVNLNKINLGFSITNGFWRGNTETIYISDHEKILRKAHNQFGELFNKSTVITEIFINREKTAVGRLFLRLFRLKSESEAKRALAKFLIAEDVKTKRVIITLGKYATQLVNILHPSNRIVKKTDVLSAIILYHLSESKANSNQLQEKISMVEDNIDVELLLHQLVNIGIIESENSYYKIRIDRVLDY